MPAYKNTISVDPQTKADWSAVLAYLTHFYLMGNGVITICPPAYARGALRLVGVIGHGSIGKLA